MEPKVFSSGKTRQGRGFSPLELKEAKIDSRMAKNLGLRIDKRRRTSYEDNIEFLKKKAAKEKKRQEKKAKKKGKKTPSKKKKSATGAKKPSKTKRE